MTFVGDDERNDDALRDAERSDDEPGRDVDDVGRDDGSDCPDGARVGVMSTLIVSRAIAKYRF